MLNKIRVNGTLYVAKSPKEANKMRQVAKMIEDHKKGSSLETIVEAYDYNSEFYVKRLFKNFGYVEAHSDKYLANRSLGKSSDPKQTPRDALWSKLLSSPIIGD